MKSEIEDKRFRKKEWGKQNEKIEKEIDEMESKFFYLQEDYKQILKKNRDQKEDYNKLVSENKKKLSRYKVEMEKMLLWEKDQILGVN